MPGVMRVVQVTSTPARIQSLLVNNDPVMLVNPDILNNIFIGNDQSNQLIAVPALGSITIDPNQHDIWTSTNGGNFTVNAYLLPKGTNWVPSPAQIAAQINALGLATAVKQDSQSGGAGRSIATDMLNANKGVTTEVAALLATGNAGGTPGGIPLLRKTAQLGAGSNLNVLAGATPNLISNVNLNQPSFEMSISCISTGAATIPFFSVNIVWTDSVSGATMGSKKVFITQGNGVGFQIQTYITGPVYGNQMSVSVTNFDPAVTANIASWVINQVSHVYDVIRTIQPIYIAVPNFTLPDGSPATGTIAFTRPTILANGNAFRLCAAYSGKAILGIDNAGGTSAIWVSLEDPGKLYQTTATSPRMQPIAVAASTNFLGEVALPHGPVLLAIENKSTTTAVTPSVTLTAMDY